MMIPTPDYKSALRADGLSVLDYASALLARWRLVVGTPIVTAIAAIGVSFLIPNQWSSQVAFVPVSGASTGLPSALSSLAGQFGVSLNGGSSTDSPDFYEQLIKSQTIMNQVLLSRFRVSGGDTLRLLDILKVSGVSLEDSLENGQQALNDIVSTSVDRASQIVAVSVLINDPALSAAIANRYLVLLNQFNLEGRESQARDSRIFVEGQLAEAEHDMNVAEDSLRTFLTRNRRTDTPELQFENSRLQRQLQFQQDLYTNLRQNYESARLQEVNNTPVLQIVQRAVPPVHRTSPRRGRLAIFGFALGELAALGTIVAQAAAADSRRRSDAGFLALERTWSTARHEWADAWRRLRARLSRRGS